MTRTKSTATLAALMALLWGASGCGLIQGLIATRIVVKGARRSLMDQVLGAYEEVAEDEVFLLASVRYVDPLTGDPSPPPKLTASEQRALEARRSIEFNRDDVLLFKRLGYVGEGSDGRLIFFEQHRAGLEKQNPWLFELVRDVTREENEARERIVRRIIEITPELQDERGERTVWAILAAKHREEAAPGTRIQLPDGTWHSKPEGGGSA